MKKNLIQLGQQGFGLVESMITAAILGIGTYIILTGLDFMNEQKGELTQEIAMELMISSLVESIRSNISREKIDFNADAFLSSNTLADVKASLPMRWNNMGIMTPEDCGYLPADACTATPENDCNICKGRMGYVVTPYKIGTLEIRGLYLLTIRLTHETILPHTYREYKIIVRGP